MATVLISPATLRNAPGPYRDTLLAAGLELKYQSKGEQLVEEELFRELPGCSAVLAGSEPYTRRVLEANPKLRVIARAGVGYDAVDVKTCTERGIAVCTTPGTNHDAVAEHTFALILGLAKSVASQDAKIKAGGWPRQTTQPLRGRVLGIAGLGRIGKAVALRGAAFGMKLLAFEPFPDNSFVQQNHITLVPLERLLAESDFLSIHVPLTPESKYLINRKTLAIMKPSAFVVNTARGPLIHEGDLYEALRAGKLAGAGLDVFEQEPPGKMPLLELPNVLTTAHTAGVDTQSLEDMARSAAEAIVALSRGEWPVAQVVNPDARARFRWEG